MKKSGILWLCIALIFVLTGLAGCKLFGNAPTASTQTQPKNVVSGNIKSKIFKPSDLLSEAEAARLVGVPKITIDPNTLKIDTEMGMSNTYYAYDVPTGTHHALFQLVQNAAMSKENLSYASAAKLYNADYNKVKNQSEVLSDIGDKAFYFQNESQLFVLYGNYFFLLAFQSPGGTRDREVNIAIAKLIVENIAKQ